MTVSVDIDLGYEFAVKAPFKEVFALLADVPKSASHFPKVKKLHDLGDNAYRWEMQKIGIDKYSIQTIYACRYASDKTKGSVTWTPVAGVGNASVEGSWSIRREGGSTSISLAVKGNLTVPLPSLAKRVVAPVARREFESMVDKYIENLKKTFAA